MGALTKFTKLSGAALLTAGLVAGGTLAATAASADEQPIEPADAPEIMERPWPAYPDDAETHRNIWVATLYLNNQIDDDGNPYWGQPPTNTFSPELEEALSVYQDDMELGEHGHLKEEMWGHFSDLQFGSTAAEVPWGPREGQNFYTVGDSGPGVHALQSLLEFHEYLPPEGVDGDFGTDTEQAVIEFQTDVVCDEADIGVSASDCIDGLVGEVTWRAQVAFEPDEVQTQ